jgi:hypothetical protein
MVEAHRLATQDGVSKQGGVLKHEHKRSRTRKYQLDQGVAELLTAAELAIPKRVSKRIPKQKAGTLQSMPPQQWVSALRAATAARLKASAELAARLGTNQDAHERLDDAWRGLPAPDGSRALRFAADGRVAFDERAMSAMRLGGVLDAMQRAGLTASRLVALANRLAAGYEVASDLALLDALPSVDLAAANLTPAAFIIESAAPLRTVVEAMWCVGEGSSGLLIPPEVVVAALSIGAMLATRLRMSPDAAAIAAIGDAFESGAIDAGELAIVRALPAQYLRSVASGRHWGVFAQYRDA